MGLALNPGSGMKPLSLAAQQTHPGEKFCCGSHSAGGKGVKCRGCRDGWLIGYWYPL